MPAPLPGKGKIAKLTLDEPGIIPEDSPVQVDNRKVVKIPKEVATDEEEAEQLTTCDELVVRQTESVPVSNYV